MLTREEWLKCAVKKMDEIIFSNELDLENHEFQIACGRCKGKNLFEVIQPSDAEDIGLDDFFPTTISISYEIKDPIDILKALATACFPAFFNMKPKGKLFVATAKKYDFEYTETAGWTLPRYILENVYNDIKKEIGDYPGKPVKFPTKDKKDKKKTSYAIFCPECGYEVKITRKLYEKHNSGLPTCPCGAKMGIDMEEENTDNENEN